MIELRWLMSRDFVSGTCSMAMPQTDGSVLYQRLQYRETPQNMVEREAAWQEIPIFREISEGPKLELVKRRDH